MAGREAGLGGRRGDNGQAHVLEEMRRVVDEAIVAVCPPGGSVRIVDVKNEYAGTRVILSPSSLPYLENLRGELRRRRDGARYSCALAEEEVQGPGNELTSLGSKREKTVVVYRIAGPRRIPVLHRAVYWGGVGLMIATLLWVLYYLLALQSRAIGDL